MPELVIYLLKVNIALVVFYLIYRIFLRKLTFYTLNRYYLLGALTFSLLYPWIDLSDFWIKEAPDAARWAQQLPQWNEKMQFEALLWVAIETLFWTFAAFFVLRFLVRIVSLWKLHQKSAPAQWFAISYRRVFEKINPFSFLNHIYVNTDCHKEEELSDIFIHEHIHVKEKHSLDMILVELYTAFNWFNPAMWLIRFAIHENLEFITDRRVLQSGVDKKEYQFSLMHIGTNLQNNNAGLLVSNFNLRQLKRRISMMNSQRSNYLHLGRYAFSFPIIFLLLFIVGFAKGYQNKELVIEVVDRYRSDESSDLLSVYVQADTILQRRETSSVNGDPQKQGHVVTFENDTLIKKSNKRYPDNSLKGTVKNLKAIPNADDTQIKSMPTEYVRIQGVEMRNPSERFPTVFYDGKQLTSEEFSRINPNDIHSIDVLKQASENGIIIVNSKSMNADTARRKEVSSLVSKELSLLNSFKTPQNLSAPFSTTPTLYPTKKAMDELISNRLHPQYRYIEQPSKIEVQKETVVIGMSTLKKDAKDAVKTIVVEGRPIHQNTGVKR